MDGRMNGQTNGYGMEKSKWGKMCKQQLKDIMRVPSTSCHISVYLKL